MKKYLIIGNGESPHLLKWINALSTYYELYLISSSKTQPALEELLPPDRIFNLNIKVSPEGGNYRILLRSGRIRRILKKVTPDVVNAHYITSHGFVAALLKRYFVRRFFLVQSAWGSDILVTPFRNNLYMALTKFSLRMADLATSDSHYMTRTMRSIYPVRTLTFTFGLNTLPVFDPEEKEDFLFFSNRMLASNYNIGEILRFFERIARHKPQARLVIANDGPERKILEERVREQKLDKQVEFVGFISEEKQKLYYRQASFYLSIPSSDATSVSLLEAMAYGCIPIVSEIHANQEWITDMENGVYFRSDIEDQIFDQLLERSTMIAEMNREIIRKRAIFPDSIKKYVREITSLMEQQQVR